MVSKFLQWLVTEGYFYGFGEKHGAFFYYTKVLLALTGKIFVGVGTLCYSTLLW